MCVGYRAGMAGGDTSAPSLKGRVNQDLAERQHAPSAHPTERGWPGDTGSTMLVFPCHSTKTETCSLDSQ